MVADIVGHWEKTEAWKLSWGWVRVNSLWFSRRLYLLLLPSHWTHLSVCLFVPFTPLSLLSLCLGHFSFHLSGKLLSIFWESSPLSLLWSFLWYLPPRLKGWLFLGARDYLLHAARVAVPHGKCCFLHTCLSPGQLWVPQGQRACLIPPGFSSSQDPRGGQQVLAEWKHKNGEWLL